MAKTDPTADVEALLYEAVAASYQPRGGAYPEAKVVRGALQRTDKAAYMRLRRRHTDDGPMGRAASRRWRVTNPEARREQVIRMRAQFRRRLEADSGLRERERERHAAMSKAWRAVHPEQAQAKWREWRAANPEKVLAQRRRALDREIDERTAARERLVLRCRQCGAEFRPADHERTLCSADCKRARRRDVNHASGVRRRERRHAALAVLTPICPL